MDSEQQDYVVRLIEQLGVVLRRLVEMLDLGRASAPQVVRQAQAAQEALLGPLAISAPLVDATAAVRLMNDPRRITLWIEFLRVEAAACRLQEELERAAMLEARADALEQAMRSASRTG
jgi:hypothetical protein